MFNELDVVALTVDVPGHDLARGNVGTVVQVYAPGVYQVEFVDTARHIYGTATLRADQLRRRPFTPAAAV